MNIEVRKFEMETYSGGIPSGFELVEYEEGTDPVKDGFILYGFDEVAMFGLKNPQHAFISYGE